jgi:hypothetical protein
MDFGRLALSYGESLYDTAIERFGQNITVKRAVFIPKTAQFTQRVDVTDGFNSELIKNGGLSIENADITFEALKSSQPVSQRRLWGFLRKEAEVVSQAVTSGWLCVIFTMPGGCSYMCYYDLPNEKVTFPPPRSGNVASIVPPDRKIVSCTMVAAPQAQVNVVKEEEDDDEDIEDIVIADITSEVTKMAGPDGLYFGRPQVNLGIAINLAIESGHVQIEHILEYMFESSQNRIAFYITFADGERKEIEHIYTANQK